MCNRDQSRIFEDNERFLSNSRTSTRVQFPQRHSPIHESSEIPSLRKYGILVPVVELKIHSENQGDDVMLEVHKRVA